MFGKLLGYSGKENVLIFNFEEKQGYMKIVTPSIVEFYEENRSDFAIDPISKATNKDFTVSKKDASYEVQTSEYLFVIHDDFMVDIWMDKMLISSDIQVEKQQATNVNYELLALEGHQVDQKKDDHKLLLHKSIREDDYLYGLGEKTGFLNKRGYEYEMWNSDNPDPHVDSFKALYKSIPFYFVHNEKYTYGFFFDNTYKTYFDMGKTHSDCVSVGADNGYFNYYFIGGKTIKDVVTNYTYITGRTPMPQRFTLGHQQSRWSYMNKEEVMVVANKYREYNIPCDIIFLDIDYMERYKVFTYNNETFENLPEMIKSLREKGFKIVPIIDPGVKVEKDYFVYEEAIKNHYVATYNGETYINAVWPGDSVFPSFISPKVQAWWAGNVKHMVDYGFSGIWNDMNEPASFNGPLPMDVAFEANGKTHYHDEVHNVYGHYMAKATYEGLKKYSGKRPYIITRACYAGTQKYSTVWTGDNHSIWAHLQMAMPMLMNLGMSGFAFCGTDVGGFGSDCTKELLCRWVQVGAFTPLFRNHSAMGTRRQEPWTFDEETIAIYRKAVNLRYQLIPYFYDLYYEASLKGLPLLRPLMMEYEEDKNTFEINDEMMLGSNILVSPVVMQGARTKVTYLPEGKWYNFFTNEEYQGGYHIDNVPLDTVPVFVKEGSIIPLYPIKQYIDDENTLILKVYPGKGSYLHYQDNGEDYKYETGEYNLYEISHEDNVVKVSMLHEGYTPYKKIILQYFDQEIEIKDFNQEIIIEG